MQHAATSRLMPQRALAQAPGPPPPPPNPTNSIVLLRYSGNSLNVHTRTASYTHKTHTTSPPAHLHLHAHSLPHIHTPTLIATHLGHKRLPVGSQCVVAGHTSICPCFASLLPAGAGFARRVPRQPLRSCTSTRPDAWSTCLCVGVGARVLQICGHVAKRLVCVHAAGVSQVFMHFVIACKCVPLLYDAPR